MSKNEVGIMIVSHSPHLAHGLVDIAKQMAPEVIIEGVGGMEDGSLGTSYDASLKMMNWMLSEVRKEGKVLVCGDIGSAIMVGQTAAENCTAPERVIVMNAPLVEGVIAGAVAAQQGGTGLIVATAIEQAVHMFDPPAPEPEVVEVAAEEDLAPILVKVVDPAGLHARPAALLARLASDFDADITLNGVDATSVLSLMGLGVRQGDEVVVAANGPQANEALEAIKRILEKGSEEG